MCGWSPENVCDKGDGSRRKEVYRCPEEGRGLDPQTNLLGPPGRDWGPGRFNEGTGMEKWDALTKGYCDW